MAASDQKNWCFNGQKRGVVRLRTARKRAARKRVA